MDEAESTTPNDAWAAPTPWVPVRLGFYITCLFVGMACLPKLGNWAGIQFFFEKHGLENFQLALAVLVTVGLAWTGWRCPRVRDACIYMALLAALAVTREIDFLLDILLPGLSWKLTVAILFASANGYALWQWRRFWPQMCRYSSTVGGGILWAGFAVVVALAQWLGHQELWRPFLGEAYSRDYKRVMEEIVETFGYTLIFFGTVETMLWARRVGRAMPPEPEN